jgi:hypothetical protein
LRSGNTHKLKSNIRIRRKRGYSSLPDDNNT